MKHEIEANAYGGKAFNIIEANARPVEFIAADSGEGESLKRFSIMGYTGGKLNVGFPMPVVVDLSGLKISAKARPILKDHNPGMVVGHTDSITVNAGTLSATGVVSGANMHADEVVKSSSNGFPWQASIGASVDRMIEVGRGETVEVNGRKFTGPLLVARKSTLKEISFVALGADDNTNARVAATNHLTRTETIAMQFEQWIKGQGLDMDSLSDEAVNNLRATYEELQEKKKDVEASVNKDAEKDGSEFDLKAALSELRAEHARLADIEQVAKDHPEIKAKAISDGWSKDRTELEVLRAKRPQASNMNFTSDRSGAPSSDIISAAVCMAGNLQNIEKHFDEKTLNAANARYKGRIGLQEVFGEVAAANGYNGMPSYRRDAAGILRAAFSPMISAAGGFSTLSITDILSNTANKFLLQGYMNVERSWADIAPIRNVSDFKVHTRYRLTGDLQYEKVGAGGEIKHGTLGDQTFTNQAETYGKMLAITRQDQINDDLGALTDSPMRLGRGAGLAQNEVFWTEFLDNTSHFSSGNSNLVTSNALSIGGLTAAELKFLDQTDPDGKPLGIMPEILLVPNALNVTASQLMNATSVEVTTTANTPLPDSNPHAGKFRVVRSSYLSNATLGGAYSTSTWYLLANPASLATIEVAALNGVTNPVVETADADFNTLGIQMRGYIDFGVSLQDPRAGVKSTA